MKKLNGDKDIDQNLRIKIEYHFDNKWKTDRNIAIVEKEEH